MTRVEKLTKTIKTMVLDISAGVTPSGRDSLRIMVFVDLIGVSNVFSASDSRKQRKKPTKNAQTESETLGKPISVAHTEPKTLEKPISVAHTEPKTLEKPIK